MKRNRIYLLPVFAGLLLASCGGGSDPASTPVSSQEPPVSSAPSPDSSRDTNSSSAPVVSSSSSGQSSVSTLPPASGPATYRATFHDETGKVLQTIWCDEGVVPTYSYDKKDTAEWEYEFRGWATSVGGEPVKIGPIYEDVDYYAVLKKEKRQYTLTFSGADTQAVVADYGSSINEPDEPTKEGYAFVAWTADEEGKEAISWPLTLTADQTIYANWNEKIDFKTLTDALMSSLEMDPLSFIPEAMKTDYTANMVTAEKAKLDYTSFVNVSAIPTQGFGEQWNMVLGNIAESERFHAALALAETAISAGVAGFLNYVDKNPGSTAAYGASEATYGVSIAYEKQHLTYTLAFTTGWSVPLFGENVPQIDLDYDIASSTKTVRIQLTENNVLHYEVDPNSYRFALQYGLSNVSRKAYFEAIRDEEGTVTGQVVEFVQYKDKELMGSRAEFICGETYTSVVGNKASSMPGFSGYINELYKTEEGKLLGYEVQESFTKWGLTADYHTLWFNLADIQGLTSVKAIANGDPSFGLGAKNPYDIYLNGQATAFEPIYNKKLTITTSRKYDVEMRTRYLFGYENNELVAYESKIPMMFIQDDNDVDKNFTSFPVDIKAKSGIEASVTVDEEALTKIREDHGVMIPAFIEHEGAIDAAEIVNRLGQPKEVNQQ